MNLVDAGNVLEDLYGGSETVCPTNGVHHVNASMAVREAVVVVGIDNKVMRVPYFHQLLFAFMLEINDKVAFYRDIVSHVRQFSTLFEVGEGEGRISQESTSVGVAGIFHEVL